MPECRWQEFASQLEAPLGFEMAEEKRFADRRAALLRGEIPA